MALATLSIDLVAKLAQFESDLGKAARATEANAERMNKALGGVKAGLVGLAAGLSVGAGVDFARGIINGLDALNDLKDATGSTIENISALEDVAKRTGTSFETVGGALLKLNKGLKDIEPGNATSEALKAIGLDGEALKKIDPAEALLKIAVALRGYSDDAGKARLVQELFGKSTREVAPLLNDLANKGELVAKVTKEQAEEAERFNQQLSALKKNSEDLNREIFSGLLPTLNRMLETFTRLKETGNIGTVLKDAFKGVFGAQQLSDDPGKDINKLLGERTALQEKYNTTLAYEVKFKGQLRDGSKQLAGELEQVNKLLEVSRIRQLAAVNPIDADAPDAVSRRLRPPSVNFSGAVKKLPKASKELTNGFESLQADIAVRIAGNTAEIEGGKRLTDTQKFLLETVIKLASAKGKFTDAQKIATTADLERLAASAKLAEQFEAAQKLEEEMGKARVKNSEIALRAIEILNTENERLSQTNDQKRQALEELGLEIEGVNKLRDARQAQAIALQELVLIGARNVEGNEIEISQLERRLLLLKEERELTGKDVAKRLEIDADDANKKRTETISQSITQGLLQGFRNGSSLADIFLDELKAQFGKTVLQPIISPLVKAGNDLLASGLKSLLSSIGLPSFSVGTDFVPRDMIAQIHKGERIVPAAQNRAGSGQAITVVQNFTVGDVASASMVRQAVAGSEQRIAAGIMRNQRYGGALA